MSGYLGDHATGRVVRVAFNTVSPSTGAPATLTPGSPTCVVSKDGSDVTPSGGVTLTADAGSVTGRNTIVIDMGVDATTFAAGSDFKVRLGAGSAVGSVSAAGIVVGEWSVQNRYASGGGTVTLGTLTVTGTPTTTSIQGTSGNLGTTSGFYTGRRLYFDSSTAAPYLLTGECTHTYSGGTHTFAFAAANTGTPAVSDVAKVVGT